MQKTLNDFLLSIHEQGVEIVVSTDELVSLVSDDVIKLFSVKEILDIRSSVFFSMGLVQQRQAPIVLLVKQQYLSNCYTGIVESWFQHTNVIIVSMYNEEDTHIEISYLNKYLNVVQDTSIEDFQVSKTLVNGPCLLMMPYKEDTRKKNINISQLIKSIPSDVKSFCLSTLLHDEVSCLDLEVIDEKYKYGILSKYMGYICAANRKTCCILDEQTFCLDINILNNRYLNNFFKVIVIGDPFLKNRYKQWIETNKIKLFYKSEAQISNDFWNVESPAILIIE